MFDGAFSPSIFLRTVSYLVLATLALIYYLALYLGQEEPIPKTYISACAGHYPEFIFFRIATISGSALLFLGWLVNHFYFKSVAKEKVVRIDNYRPEVSLILGMMGAMSLMGSTANIDTGIRNGSWHQRCAASFFLLTSLAIFYNTFLCWIIYEKTRDISRTSMAIKVLLTVLMLIQMWISLENGADAQESGYGSEVNNVIEWTYSITMFLYTLSMAEDVKSFKFVYEYRKEENDC